MTEGKFLDVPCACCFTDDEETVIEPCGAHAAWRNEATQAAYERGRAAENEACARAAEALPPYGPIPTEALDIAQRIRARLAAEEKETA